LNKILVVDDEVSMREMLGIMLRKEGYEVVLAESRAMAAAVLAKGPFDLVVTDVKLPDGDGIEILRHVKAAYPDTVVIVMTAFGSTQTAVAALKLGAHDYLVKPFEIDELKIVVRGALERQELQQENRQLKAELREKQGPENIVGVSLPMQKLLGLVRAIAPTSSTVLITGESGTGKELVAKAVHALSPRREAAFVSINCAALPETLLESELFGHMKGAFTDAHQTKKGLFETAHRGTLFLDEVGEMPLTMQAKLLRVLQEKKVRRVGATEEVEVDVRLVAATNRSLERMVRERSFREDLFYRLNVIPLAVPPLRERRDDIPLLVEHFVRRFGRDMGKAGLKVAPETLARLTRYAWPGNVRELENVLERAAALEATGEIRPDRLPESLLAGPSVEVPPLLQEGFRLDAHMLAIEASLVRSALAQAAGDRGAAARILGITPRSLRYLLQKHQVVEGP
jgi:two-component system response regulator PilR (NtrC family)